MPTNPIEVDEILKKFIAEWKKKPYKLTSAEHFIDEIISTYKPSSRLWNHTYDRIQLVLLGELTRIKNNFEKNKDSYTKGDTLGTLLMIEEIQKYLDLLE